jgi:hypothetical protein
MQILIRDRKDALMPWKGLSKFPKGTYQLTFQAIIDSSTSNPFGEEVVLELTSVELESLFKIK